MQQPVHQPASSSAAGPSGASAFHTGVNPTVHAGMEGRAAKEPISGSGASAGSQQPPDKLAFAAKHLRDAQDFVKELRMRFGTQNLGGDDVFEFANLHDRTAQHISILQALWNTTTGVLKSLIDKTEKQLQRGGRVLKIIQEEHDLVTQLLTDQPDHNRPVDKQTESLHSLLRLKESELANFLETCAPAKDGQTVLRDVSNLGSDPKRPRPTTAHEKENKGYTAGTAENKKAQAEERQNHDSSKQKPAPYKRSLTGASLAPSTTPSAKMTESTENAVAPSKIPAAKESTVNAVAPTETARPVKNGNSEMQTKVDISKSSQEVPDGKSSKESTESNPVPRTVLCCKSHTDIVSAIFLALQSPERIPVAEKRLSELQKTACGRDIVVYGKACLEAFKAYQGRRAAVGLALTSDVRTILEAESEEATAQSVFLAARKEFSGAINAEAEAAARRQRINELNADFVERVLAVTASDVQKLTDEFSEVTGSLGELREPIRSILELQKEVQDLRMRDAELRETINDFDAHNSRVEETGLLTEVSVCGTMPPDDPVTVACALRTALQRLAKAKERLRTMYGELVVSSPSPMPSNTSSAPSTGDEPQKELPDHESRSTSRNALISWYESNMKRQPKDEHFEWTLYAGTSTKFQPSDLPPDNMPLNITELWTHVTRIFDLKRIGINGIREVFDQQIANVYAELHSEFSQQRFQGQKADKRAVIETFLQKFIRAHYDIRIPEGVVLNVLEPSQSFLTKLATGQHGKPGYTRKPSDNIVVFRHGFSPLFLCVWRAIGEPSWSSMGANFPGLLQRSCDILKFLSFATEEPFDEKKARVWLNYQVENNYFKRRKELRITDPVTGQVTGYDNKPRRKRMSRMTEIVRGKALEAALKVHAAPWLTNILKQGHPSHQDIVHIWNVDEENFVGEPERPAGCTAKFPVGTRVDCFLRAANSAPKEHIGKLHHAARGIYIGRVNNDALMKNFNFSLSTDDTGQIASDLVMLQSVKSVFYYRELSWHHQDPTPGATLLGAPLLYNCAGGLHSVFWDGDLLDLVETDDTELMGTLIAPLLQSHLYNQAETGRGRGRGRGRGGRGGRGRGGGRGSVAAMETEDVDEEGKKKAARRRDARKDSNAGRRRRRTNDDSSVNSASSTSSDEDNTGDETEDEKLGTDVEDAAGSDVGERTNVQLSRASAKRGPPSEQSEENPGKRTRKAKDDNENGRVHPQASSVGKPELERKATEIIKKVEMMMGRLRGDGCKRVLVQLPLKNVGIRLQGQMHPAEPPCFTEADMDFYSGWKTFGLTERTPEERKRGSDLQEHNWRYPNPGELVIVGVAYVKSEFANDDRAVKRWDKLRLWSRIIFTEVNKFVKSALLPTDVLCGVITEKNFNPANDCFHRDKMGFNNRPIIEQLSKEQFDAVQRILFAFKQDNILMQKTVPNIFLKDYPEEWPMHSRIFVDIRERYGKGPETVTTAVHFL